MRHARVTYVALSCLLALLAALLGCGQNLSSSSAPYNSGTRQGGADQFGRTVGANETRSSSGAVTGGSSLVLGIKVTMSDITGPDSEFSGDYQKFAKWARDKGFGAIAVYGVDPTADQDQVARFYFPDPAFPDGTKLSDYGFEPSGDGVKQIVAQAKQLSMGTQIDITRLACSLESSPLVARPLAGKPLSAEQIGRLCSYLVQDVGADSVTGRGFPDDWVKEAADACRQAGKVFFAGDYATLRRAESGAAALLDTGLDVVAKNELALGQARSTQYMLWAGVTGDRDYGRDSPFSAAWASLKEVEGALVYRTVLSSPQGLFLDVPPSTVDKLSADLIDRLKKVAAARRPRPVCNVMLLGDSTPKNMTAVVNGITAAGYDIVVGPAPSGSRPADAYYVVATRKADGSMPAPLEGLPADVFNLGKPCVLQVCGPIPDVGTSDEWDAVRRSFGLGTGHIDTLDSGPAQATYKEAQLPCAVAGSGAWGVSLSPAGLTDATPLVVVHPAGAQSTPAEGGAAASRDDTVVITEFRYGTSGRNVLIAGSELAPEMAWPISNELSDGRGLQAATRVLCAVGSPIGLFSPGEAGRVSLVYRDGGQDKTINQNVPKGECVVVDVAEQSALAPTPAAPAPAARPRGQ